MKLVFELWDTEDSNLIGTFESEAAALRVIRSAIQQFGPDAMSSVALGCESQSGRMVPVAVGSDLVRRASEEKDTDILASA